MNTKTYYPSEAYESQRFVAWLEAQGLLFSHIPNESPSKRQAIKNKRLGTRRGVPDFLVLVPGKVIFVELKRQRGGRVSPEQKIWVAALTAAGCPAKVCCGAQEAIEFVKENQ